MNSELEIIFIKELETNQNIIHKVCKAYTNNQDDHNDLFQEISIQLWKAYDKFRGESKFTTWMYRVALNTAISLYRKSKKRIPTDELFPNSKELTYEEYDDTKEKQLDSLYQAIHRLTDIEKALVLLYLEDKSYKDIALCLGISEVNARVKMNRTKVKLKELLNPI